MTPPPAALPVEVGIALKAYADAVAECREPHETPLSECVPNVSRTFDTLRASILAAIAEAEARVVARLAEENAARERVMAAVRAVEPDFLTNAIMGSDLIRLYGITDTEVARYHARRIVKVYDCLVAATRALPTPARPA